MLSSMLRVLLPSWNFFDRAGDQFELQIQKSDSWQNFFESAQPPRNFSNLFLNGPYNLRLAYKSNIDRFMSEAQGLTRTEIEALESYQFILRMISFERAISDYKFRIILSNGEEVFRSDV
ncbi:hypothetical protein CIK05_05595 [Bdellovibrio sp. qaytius]|nr:hypothetical protein CIK05_05595 [Bdellovibrio sp. qaytius]